jgi:Tfp pilus assembly protein PilX
LIVVAVLFFIVSLVAAYTNRNLIFEQRTSGNQYRSTQAFEAAEAGVEWALAMLNSGRIDANCAPTADAGQSSFRQRFLSTSVDTGLIVPTIDDGAGAPRAMTTADPQWASGAGDLWPSCVFDGTDWSCSCQSGAGAPALVAPDASTGVFPAFRVRFVRASTTRPEVVQLEVNGCTRLDDACLNFPAQPVAGEGRAQIRVLVALQSALPSMPTAALTVRGDFEAADQGLGVFNPTPGSSGIAVLAGGDIDGWGVLNLGGAPGAPADPALLLLPNDTALDMGVIPPGPRLFVATYGATDQTYRDQPATLVLDCAAGCDADFLRGVAARNPGRILWAQGDVDLDAGAPLGAPDNPVLLVVEGGLNVAIPVFGLIHGRDVNWLATGTATGVIRGAMIAENDLDLSGGASFSVVHDAQVLSRLRWRHGSFVRVPGSWKDF